MPRDFDPALVTEIQKRIRDVPDFPKPGIIFKDLTPVLAHGPTFRSMIGAFAERYAPMSIDAIVGIEARGFLVAAPLAALLGKGLILMRKPGKLPWKTHKKTYALEYGSDSLEMHHDAFEKGARLVVCDDLLATGGTMGATLELLREHGGEIVEAAFIVELGFLDGRSRLGGAQVAAMVKY